MFKTNTEIHLVYICITILIKNKLQRRMKSIKFTKSIGLGLENLMEKSCQMPIFLTDPLQ